MDIEIYKPTEAIAAWHDVWKKTRAFVDGERAVKAQGEAYLPKVSVKDSPAAYEAHKLRTNFFPATFKIAQGWLGLIFRKSGLFAGTADVELLSQLVTRDHLSRDELSAWFVRETMITNFAGALTDHPSRSDYPVSMSAADEYALGFRPYIARYTGECILEAARGIKDNKVTYTHVRLLENNGNTVRQLLFNDEGNYEVRIHTKDETGWAEVKRYVPTKDGKPLREIPFRILNTDNSNVPTPSIMQNIADLNAQHYVHAGTLAHIIYITSAPIANVTGFERTPEEEAALKADPDSNPWPMEPGTVWEFKDKDVEVDWFTYDPQSQDLLINRMREIKDELSAVGHSILAPEKPAPEAAETQLIRRNAENAMLADFTKRVSLRLKGIYDDWASWVDGSSVDFALNEDFIPQPMTPAQGEFLAKMNMNGQLSKRLLLKTLQEGELLPQFDLDAELASQASEDLDSPPVDAG